MMECSEDFVDRWDSWDVVHHKAQKTANSEEFCAWIALMDFAHHGSAALQLDS